MFLGYDAAKNVQSILPIGTQTVDLFSLFFLSFFFFSDFPSFWSVLVLHIDIHKSMSTYMRDHLCTIKISRYGDIKQYQWLWAISLSYSGKLKLLFCATIPSEKISTTIPFSFLKPNRSHKCRIQKRVNIPDQSFSCKSKI